MLNNSKSKLYSIQDFNECINNLDCDVFKTMVEQRKIHNRILVSIVHNSYIGYNNGVGYNNGAGYELMNVYKSFIKKLSLHVLTKTVRSSHNYDLEKLMEFYRVVNQIFYTYHGNTMSVKVIDFISRYLLKIIEKNDYGFIRKVFEMDWNWNIKYCFVSGILKLGKLEEDYLRLIENSEFLNIVLDELEKFTINDDQNKHYLFQWALNPMLALPLTTTKIDKIYTLFNYMLCSNSIKLKVGNITNIEYLFGKAEEDDKLYSREILSIFTYTMLKIRDTMDCISKLYGCEKTHVLHLIDWIEEMCDYDDMNLNLQYQNIIRSKKFIYLWYNIKDTKIICL